jgi:AcrR family transcriptional regulator
MRHEKVEVIFQAAVKVFAESGFDQAKMDDIAQVAGVAKGTIYYHFKSKEELFVGLMNEGMEKLLDCTRRNVEQRKTPDHQLAALIHSHILFFIQNGKLAKLLLTEAFGTKERQKQFRAKIRQYLDFIEEILYRGINTGDFILAHPHETASAIFGAASMVVLQKLYSMEEKTAEEIEAETPEIIESLHQLLFHSIITNKTNIFM